MTTSNYITFILLGVIGLVFLIDLYLKRKNKLATTKEIEKVVDKENPEKPWWKNKVVIIISSVVLGAGLLYGINEINNELNIWKLFNTSTEESAPSEKDEWIAELIEHGIICPLIYTDNNKLSLLGNCKLKYTNNGISYIFTLSAGNNANHFDITEHIFYKEYKDNISLEFFDDDGFIIYGPKILWNDMRLINDFEDEYEVLRADGFMQMNESDFYRITGRYGNLKFE